jgi:hypothetical protein
MFFNLPDRSLARLLGGEDEAAVSARRDVARSKFPALSFSASVRREVAEIKGNVVLQDFPKNVSAVEALASFTDVNVSLVLFLRYRFIGVRLVWVRLD